MSISNIDYRIERPVYEEGYADGAVTAGMPIAISGVTSGKFDYAVADAGAKVEAIAAQDKFQGSLISHAYEDDELMQVITGLVAGDVFNGLIADGSNLTKGDKISTDGSGAYVAASGRSYVTGTAGTAITWSVAKDEPVFVKLIDPAGNTQSLAVSVEGNIVSVSLATDGSGAITSTPALIVAAVNGDSDAAAIVSAAGEGTSAVSATEFLMNPDNYEYCAETVDNSTGGAVARMLVRVR